MTTTSGNSLVTRLTSHTDPHLNTTGQNLASAISTYSVTKINNVITPVEVTDGLPVLGAPIGCKSFCQDFLKKALSRAESDATKLTTHLEDLQTTLRLFSMCTAQKITHLFAHDVYNTSMEDLPDQLWLWNSAMTDQFSNMTADLLANITNQSSVYPCTHS
jgi:hypothetical protein